MKTRFIIQATVTILVCCGLYAFWLSKSQKKIPTTVLQQTEQISHGSSNSNAKIQDAQMNSNAWSDLINVLGLSSHEIKAAAPHFPIEINALNTEQLILWIKLYPQEVAAFINMPSVKSFSPSKIALGIDHIETRTEIYYPYWYRYKLMPQRLAQSVLPHFPLPNRNLPISTQELQFKKDFIVWEDHYPEEFTAMNEHFFGVAHAENEEVLAIKQIKNER